MLLLPAPSRSGGTWAGGCAGARGAPRQIVRAHRRGGCPRARRGRRCGADIGQALELAGHRVHVATDGRSGLEKTRALRPDVIDCDIGLPDIDGYEIARTLREDRTLRAVRLVALSGYAQADDLRQASDVGFDVHLAKPSSIEALLASLSG